MKKILLIFILNLLTFKIFSADLESEKKIRLINTNGAGIIIMGGVPWYENSRYSFEIEGYANKFEYVPFPMGAMINFKLFKPLKFFNVSFAFVPHIVLVNVNPGLHGYEFGINGFLHLNFELHPRWVFSLIAGSGPHYLSQNSKKQISGYIFSDNLYVNLRRQFFIGGQSFEASFMWGWRHISNAELAFPNGGYDNTMYGITILKHFTFNIKKKSKK